MMDACALIIPILALFGFGLVVYDFGFKPFWQNSPIVIFWGKVVLNALAIFLGLRIFLNLFIVKKRWSRFFNFFGWLFILFLAAYVLPTKAALTVYDTNKFLFLKLLLYSGLVITFVTETSYLIQFIYNHVIQPALLFLASFILLIFIGTFLLMLPNATTGGIKLIDALFTATSAVCVTGLAVVDTATHFTTFGHLIIVILIQIGGLGIMTFAGLLAYAVTGQSTLKTELAFRDMMSNRQINNIMHFVYQVVSVTFLFEAIGTVCIYFSLDDALFDRKLDRLFFSMFHSISAFCNAGFSTYTNGLFESLIRYNYTLHLIIALLIILGGIGFPIIFNLSQFIKVRAINLIHTIVKTPKKSYLPKIININARLSLVMTGGLLLIGFVSYLLFELDNTLQDHPSIGGKIVTSFFGAVTPRTGGFNSVDMTVLSLPMILIYLLLMWIGASPGSMGGGIRTTTAGVAVLNMVSILRGKDRTEFNYSEISPHSIRRAFAIIVLSFLLIGFFIFLVSINDSDKGLINIAFETFSAFSTTGLSLGITSALSSQSKLVLVITMFIGRVGMLTLFAVFIKQTKQLYYRYPKEDITF